jgi:hypothetical protein
MAWLRVSKSSSRIPKSESPEPGPVVRAFLPVFISPFFTLRRYPGAAAGVNFQEVIKVVRQVSKSSKISKQLKMNVIRLQLHQVGDQVLIGAEVQLFAEAVACRLDAFL